MTKRQAFVAEYLIDLNSTKAAERAGYSAKSASSQGSRLLRDVKVRANIDAALARRGRNLDIKATEVLQELARIAFSDVRCLFRADGTMKDLCELDDVTAAAVSGFEVVAGKDGAHTRPVLRKIRLADKGAALEKLGKHLGIFAISSDRVGEPADRLQDLIDAMNAGPVPPGAILMTDNTNENEGKDPDEKSTS